MEKNENTKEYLFLCSYSYLIVLNYSMLNSIMQRKIIYIYTEEADPRLLLPYQMCYSYEDTVEAVTGDDMEIHTIQIVFLSHKWIIAGYDVVLRSNGLEYSFDLEWLYQFDVEPSKYYLLDLYLWGFIGGDIDDQE